MRVSNFLLWQIAYAEIYVTETLWPDFNRARLLEAFVDYQKRERRLAELETGTSESGARGGRMSDVFLKVQNRNWNMEKSTKAPEIRFGLQESG